MNRTLLLTALALCLSSPALADPPEGVGAQNDCSPGSPAFDGFCGVGANTPGPKGDTGETGPQGEPGPQGEQGVAGKDGVDGKDGVNGKDGKDFDMDESLALSSALSMPVWLGDQENFAVSGGVGFSESNTAFGATGVMRLDKNWSGFVGGAVSEGGSWAGKAGARVGW